MDTPICEMGFEGLLSRIAKRSVEYEEHDRGPVFGQTAVTQDLRTAHVSTHEDVIISRSGALEALTMSEHADGSYENRQAARIVEASINGLSKTDVLRRMDWVHIRSRLTAVGLSDTAVGRLASGMSTCAPTGL